ncbi:MAG: aspartate/glutamate racemase family protein [Fimbriimonadaceae bacterium]
MRTIGLLGGVSWESTAVYYRTLNELTKTYLGETHSCPLLLYSFNFEPLRQLSFAENWEEIAALMCDQGKRLEAAGADCVLICANTMHRVADEVQASLAVPLLSLLDAVGREANRLAIQRVGLLGTKYTMQGKFYADRLASEWGLDVVVPNLKDQATVNSAIYDELTLGKFTEATRAAIRAIISQLIADGSEGIILGCTELPMLLDAADSTVPLLDTTKLHCEAAVSFALQ